MIQIGNREIEALFDTGAARSLLHEKVYRSLPSNMQLASAETTVALFDVQNKQLSNLGKVTLNVKYGDKLLEQEFIVTNGITEMCIFGIDAIFKHEFVLCGKTKAIFIAGQEEEKPPSCYGNREMQTVEMERIPPFTSRFVRARIRGADYSLLGGFPFIFNPAKSSAGPSGECNLQPNTLSRHANLCLSNLQPNELSRHADFCGTSDLQQNLLSRHANINENGGWVSDLQQDMLSRHAIIEESFDVTRDDGIYHILVKNAGEKELVFNKGCTLGTIEIGCKIVGALKEGVAPEPVINKEDGPQQLDASSIEIALMLVDEQFRPGMRKLLTDYAYLFKKGDRLGCTSVIKHHINTQGRGPIRLRPYRTARRYEEDLQRQIQTLLDLDVIEY